MDSVEAICVMERYLDEAMRGHVQQVRIIHGKGTGVLRAAVHQELKKNSLSRHSVLAFMAKVKTALPSLNLSNTAVFGYCQSPLKA
jgi:DNA-nicking Smr family endonuclease